MGARHGWEFYTTLTVQVLLTMMLMVEAGAGKIGPGSENHSTTRRILALLSLLAGIAYFTSQGPEKMMLIPIIFNFVMAVVGALCEPIREVPIVYRPFVRRGFLGRLFGLFFYPGWASGVFYALLMAGLADWWMYTLFIHSPHKDVGPGGFIAMVALIGTLLLPLAILKLTRFKFANPLFFYLIFQGAFSLMALLGAISTGYSSSSHPTSVELLVAVVPTTALWLSHHMNGWSGSEASFEFIAVTGMTLLSLIIVLIRSIPAWRTIRAMEKAASSLPTANASPQTAPQPAPPPAPDAA
jgi:hypothetical protein